MLAISLTFPAKRFHATPWGRHVNEGAVEWPPSPWRLMRSLIATWYHKFPDVTESTIRRLVEKIAQPPLIQLPPASQGHTRHYMPLVNGDKTKIFETFVAVEPNEAVVFAWPDVELEPACLSLLDQIVGSMTYFGRAESWVCGQLLDNVSVDGSLAPIGLGVEPPAHHELVRTLVPMSPDEHDEWYTQTREAHRQRRLEELRTAAAKKGKPSETVKLSRKDEQAIEESLPASVFDALHADTEQLQRAGWNQPPGSRWINYPRSDEAFTCGANNRRLRRPATLPTVARFAVAGPVRPRLTEALFIGDRVRQLLMGCSQTTAADANAAAVFSGKLPDGSRLKAGHQHAHFLCEANAGDHRITHLTVYAPMGFSIEDERALARLHRVWGHDGYDLQMVLLGIGQPAEFGGTNEKAGQSPILAESDTWISRTPFVLNRHLKIKRSQQRDADARQQATLSELRRAVRFELARRAVFEDLAEGVSIEPLLGRDECGTLLGGHFARWLDFRRERKRGHGSRAGSLGYGFMLRFPKSIRGPIALGYGCHFGLGQFVPLIAESRLG